MVKLPAAEIGLLYSSTRHFHINTCLLHIVKKGYLFLGLFVFVFLKKRNPSNSIKITGIIFFFGSGGEETG